MRASVGVVDHLIEHLLPASTCVCIQHKQSIKVCWNNVEKKEA